MTTRLRFILASLALGATILARAESVPARSAAGRTIGPMLVALDSDHDGMLSAKEIAAAPVALTALDINDDGIISRDEWRATNAEGRPGRVWRGAASYHIALTLDANQDGDIQSMEIANAVSSLKRLDLNGNGALTPDELRPVVVARNHS